MWPTGRRDQRSTRGVRSRCPNGPKTALHSFCEARGDLSQTSPGKDAMFTSDSGARNRSAAYHFLKCFRVACTLHCYFRGRSFKLVEVFAGELDGSCAEVFFQSMKFGCARNRNDPRLLREQPSESDLCG